MFARTWAIIRDQRTSLATFCRALENVSPRATKLKFSVRRYSNGGTMNIFDRKAKRMQRNRACAVDDPGTYDYLKDAIAEQVVDRVCDVARLVQFIFHTAEALLVYRRFPLALDVGCGRGHVAKQMNNEIIDRLVQCDYAEIPLVK